jgi:endonuclease/exonuclease/phosphatase family metal-dependent hydrolase
MEMTVMTFNLRYATDNDGDNRWANRVSKAADAVLDHRPLVVGTQEGYAAMLRDLEPLLSDYAWIGNGRFGEHENEHCAIFYDRRMLELKRQGQFWLSETPDAVASKSWGSMFPRICTWALFSHRDGGGSFYVYNTHLDHHSAEARSRGCAVLWERVRRQRSENGLPALIVGDFNSTPGDWPIRFLRGEIAGEDGARPELTDAYLAMDGRPGRTAHSFRGGDDGEPIDYIFATPEFLIESVLVDRSERDGGYPSDHYPVVARLKRI